MRPPLGRRVLARRALATLGATALVVPLISGSAFATPSNTRSSIAGTRPAWASTAPVVGAPAQSTKISFNVVLPLRDAAGAARLATAVSDPMSAQYGQYVTAAQFNAAYGPTADQVAAVKTYLSGAGLDVTGVAAGNRWISVTATAHQVESVFGTTLHNYSYRGHTLREPSTTLSVPQSIAGLISGIVGIGSEGSLRRPEMHQPSSDGTAVLPAAASPNATAACSTYWNQHQQTGPTAYGVTSFPTTNCGYSALQLRTAYGLQPSVAAGKNGSGITVAIIDAYANPTMLSDANDLATFEGEPTFAPNQYTETTFPPFTDQTDCGGEAGWNTEESLDVEAVHAVAPGATVHYIGATNCEDGIDNALNYVVQNQTADIISNSYGNPGEDGIGSEVTTEHAIFVQAAAEGIGFYFSSGDDGDNYALGNTASPEPDYPASDPLVTGVGGTSLAVTHTNAYQFETSWGDDADPVNGATGHYAYAVPGNFQFGAGGGVSTLFTQPSYQTALVPPSLAKLNGGAAMRVVPDIAAVADPETGFIIEFDGTQYVYGGTSLACPLIAGIQALVSQGRIVPIGFANPELYSLGTSAFHDVKAPSSTLAMMTPSGSALITIGKDTSLTATAGYDDTTGLGTPNGLNFLLGERLLSSQPVAGVTHSP